jgi:glycosyltransferase involved in cell wall biosynthesis
MQAMRIAQVAPLYESVPPTHYGGTERIVSYLTEELVRCGHRVTLFASGGSQTAAELVALTAHPLRLDPRCIDRAVHHVLLLERVFQRADEFDVIHFHIDYLHFPLSRRHAAAQLTTLHGRLDVPDIVPLYREFTEMPLVSISDAQRVPLAGVNWQATVHHGLPEEAYRFQPGPGDYFAFLGRISPEKRLDRAIEIARRVGVPLRVAAKVDPVDEAYFHAEIEPLLDHPLVEFINEISEREKSDFLGNARALLFPIDWPEPFGLVVIEALACGTPVIAYRHGSVPELVEAGTGFVVETIEEAVAAAQRIPELSRERCREVFERRFTAARMARDYVGVYERFMQRPVQVYAAGKAP